LNTYGYVGGNPTNFIDAFGLYRSHWLLRLLVPGQVAWDDALTAWENGNKGTAFALAGAMIGEQVLTVLTLGEFQAARSGVQCLSNNVAGSLDDLFRAGRTPKASELKKFAEQQGWKLSRTANGPIKYMDKSGVYRMTIKRGSSRAPGSGNPHVELRNPYGQRIDPAGNAVTRKSPGNHTPIKFDL